MPRKEKGKFSFSYCMKGEGEEMGHWDQEKFLPLSFPFLSLSQAGWKRGGKGSLLIPCIPLAAALPSSFYLSSSVADFAHREGRKRQRAYNKEERGKGTFLLFSPISFRFRQEKMQSCCSCVRKRNSYWNIFQILFSRGKSGNLSVSNFLRRFLDLSENGKDFSSFFWCVSQCGFCLLPLTHFIRFPCVTLSNHWGSWLVFLLRPKSLDNCASQRTKDFSPKIKKNIELHETSSFPVLYYNERKKRSREPINPV